MFQADPFVPAKVEARRFVAREGQREYLHPDYVSDVVSDDRAASRAPRALAVKLAVMAIVMVGLLTAVLVIFT